MFDRIFGQYLNDEKILTKRQLLEVYKQASRGRAKIGFIAVREGLLTEEQADEINDLQKRTDELFGQIAVEYDYLTDTQLERIVSMQKNCFLAFTQALVLKDFMSLRKVREWEEEYRVANGFMISELAILESEELERIVPLFLQMQDKHARELLIMGVKSFYRLIDPYIGLTMSQLRKTAHFERLSVISFDKIADEGSAPTDDVTHGFVAIGGRAKDMICFAARQRRIVLLNPVEEEQVEMEQAAGEFLSYTTSLYLKTEGAKQLRFVASEPKFYKQETKISAPAFTMLPIHMDDATVYLMVSLHNDLTIEDFTENPRQS